MTAPDLAGQVQFPWQILDSGVLPGHENMTIDRWALEEMDEGLLQIPKLRFFQWDKPTLSFGYLMDQGKVKEWALANGRVDYVQRPTAGGAVFHGTSDLSFSLLWPRKKNILPEHPRACYEAIHQRVKAALEKFSPDQKLSLFARTVSAGPDCAAQLANVEETPVHFSICFETPVCNDVMESGKKIVGGALRLTKKAIMYQGNIILMGKEDPSMLKKQIEKKLTGVIARRP